MHPRISIVVPVRNAAAWLPETLASIVRQSYPSSQFEVIVVDDASTDDSGSTAQDILAASHVRFLSLTHDSAQGPSACRNAGWRIAKGEWIQFLDADDVLHERKLEHQVQAALSASTATAMIYSPWSDLVMINGEWRRESSVRTPDLSKDPVLDPLTPEGFVQIGSALVRRSSLEAIGGFNEAHWLIEDVDLLMRLALNGGEFLSVASDAPSMWYRRRQGSLSGRSAIAFLDACLRNADFALEQLRAQDRLTAGRRRALADIYHGLVTLTPATDARRRWSIIERIHSIDPAFVPLPPSRLRWLARVVGYRRSEALVAPLRAAMTRPVASRSVALPS